MLGCWFVWSEFVFEVYVHVSKHRKYIPFKISFQLRRLFVWKKKCAILIIIFHCFRLMLLPTWRCDKDFDFLSFIRWSFCLRIYNKSHAFFFGHFFAITFGHCEWRVRLCAAHQTSDFFFLSALWMSLWEWLLLSRNRIVLQL